MSDADELWMQRAVTPAKAGVQGATAAIVLDARLRGHDSIAIVTPAAAARRAGCPRARA
jgi:hypothetical protein